MAIKKSDAHTLIHQYSEWLDGEELIVPDAPDSPRTHDDLVDEFLRTRQAFALPVVES